MIDGVALELQWVNPSGKWGISGNPVSDWGEQLG